MSLFQREQDQILSISLYIPRIDAKLVKQLPNGFLVEPNGAVQVQISSIISTLFGIHPDKIKSMISNSKHGISVVPPVSYDPVTKELRLKEDISKADILGGVAQQLMGLGHSMEQLRKSTFYLLADENLKIYVVIVGKLATPPPGAVQGQLHG